MKEDGVTIWSGQARFPWAFTHVATCHNQKKHLMPSNRAEYILIPIERTQCENYASCFDRNFLCTPWKAFMIQDHYDAIVSRIILWQDGLWCRPFNELDFWINAIGLVTLRAPKKRLSESYSPQALCCWGLRGHSVRTSFWLPMQLLTQRTGLGNLRTISCASVAKNMG
jgi:hypothetical protein